MPLPLRPEALDDDAIQSIADTLGLKLLYEEQWQYLRGLETQDVQAAPGCGKTTLTAAKLCLLLQGWQSGTQGVCVLSHTNVAKDEIIRIVSGHPAGRKLLGYPHFIGTIQAFVHTFLALPALRAQGIELRSVDDEVYARAAERRLSNYRYASLAALTRRRQDILLMVRTATMFFGDGAIKIGPAHVAFPFKESTESAQQFETLKRELLTSGYLRYADMYALARAHLHYYPVAREALRQRFPLLIIDEAQDTDQNQENFINSLFACDDVVMQRIGDVNQRIYGEEPPSIDASNSFPGTDHLLLPQTMRFGSRIATAASRLTSTIPHEIIGNPDREPGSPLVIILFDKKTVGRVEEAFGKIVTERVDQADRSKYGVRMVGARKQGALTSFPATLLTYFPEYHPPSTVPQMTSLSAACHRARFLMAAKDDIAAAMECLWGAVAESLQLCKVRLDGRRPTRARILDELHNNSLVHVRECKRRIFELAFEQCDAAADWDAKVGALFAAFPGTPTRTAEFDAYCAYDAKDWKEIPRMAEVERPQPDGGQAVQPILSTIHAAKGETHAATLILECCFRGIFDLKEVLPILIGKHDTRRLRVKTVQDDIKNIFVAMTRARSLVAFALLKDHLDHPVSEFEAAGWEVVDLTLAGDK